MSYSKWNLAKRGLLLCLFSYNTALELKSQSVKQYFVPSGINKSTFYYRGEGGNLDTGSKMIWEYLAGADGATIFVSNFQGAQVLSRKKEEYFITDSAIYLVNVNTENILSTRRENFLGYRNCYLKMPKKGSDLVWTYNESDQTSYKCVASLSTFKFSDSLYSAIKVIKTPLENGKYLTALKTVCYFIDGKGLFKEDLYSTKANIYTLYQTVYTHD
jgi:hypothetical protein